jgi:hypothetical protein
MNPLLTTSDVDEFLNGFNSKSRRRGKIYFQDGAVIQLSCTKPDAEYVALVRGSQIYEVRFEYDPDSGWSSECTCLIKYDCKHAYAAMLALKANPIQYPTPRITTNAGTKAAMKKSRSKSASEIVAFPQQEYPQPPASPLCTTVTQTLGRRLDLQETDYVRRVQHLYQRNRTERYVSSSDFRQIAPELKANLWEAWELWQKTPQDDLQFWLYCAWEMRRRELTIPQFMLGATNFSSIESGMKAWERNKAVTFWRNQLKSKSVPDEEGSEPVDFRLMICPDEARLQWKEKAGETFKEIKQTHVRRFIDEYQNGKLVISPGATSLWLAVYNPYDFHTVTRLDYDMPANVKLLARVLRNSDLSARIVNAAGEPLARPSDPLKYKLDHAKDESDDYRLALVMPDDSPCPPVLLTLAGNPPLYLTENALFEGPPPHGFDPIKPLAIPAPALETAAGVRFFQGLHLDLPPRLAERTRRVEMVVKLRCELKPTHPGSATEAAFIRVTAETESGLIEHCGSWGWYHPANNGSAGVKPKDDTFIELMDRSIQKSFPARLDSLGAKWDDCQACWRVRMTKAFPELFLPWLESLPRGVEVSLDRQLATLRDEPISGTVRLDVEEAGVDWFDLKVALNVSDTTLTQEELKLLLNARGGYVRLGKKGWRRLQFDFTPEDDERLASLGLNAGEFTAEPQRLHALQLAHESAKKFLPEQQAEKIQRRASELKARVTPDVPPEIHAELRPYQHEGFHFLAYLTANRFGGVLADDMGLGKTLQAIAWLQWLRNTAMAAHGNGNGEAANASAGAPACLPSLVVCPKSVMDNWRAEAERFCPGLRVQLWRGEDASSLETARSNADLLVMNYPQLRNLSPAIAQHRWHAAILDEAQYIKNPDSQTAQVARSLQADHRLALTGTPIENRLLDLWSILAFAMPGVLGNRAQFTRSYNQQDDPFARRRLAARVRPFLLRRTKGQVAQDLPDRVEEDLVCEMDGEQRTLYRAEFKRAQQMLLRIQTQQELNEQRFNFLTSLLRLRQICCHPALVNIDLKKAESAKVNALLDLLEPIMEEGHKVLVFSQFVSMLDILSDTIKQRGWNQFFLAGDTENRGDLVKDFQGAKGAAVFLISLKAGGFGLNLTAASYVVLFDPWWNPAVESQAIDRTHRIGQTSKVIAYRLLIKNSIEQKIRQLQQSKAALAQDVLGEEKFSQSLTLDDLRVLFAED